MLRSSGILPLSLDIRKEKDKEKGSDFLAALNNIKEDGWELHFWGGIMYGLALIFLLL